MSTVTNENGVLRIGGMKNRQERIAEKESAKDNTKIFAAIHEKQKMQAAARLGRKKPGIVIMV